MRFNQLAILFTLPLLFCFTACGDSEEIENETTVVSDYRDKWVGEYEGTKSFQSFDDDMFATDITFSATKDSSSIDGMIVNGILFSIGEDGVFGPEFTGGGEQNYTVIFTEPDVTIESFGSIPTGIILPCYIKATKQ